MFFPKREWAIWVEQMEALPVDSFPWTGSILQKEVILKVWGAGAPIWRPLVFGKIENVSSVAASARLEKEDLEAFLQLVEVAGTIYLAEQYRIYLDKVLRVDFLWFNMGHSPQAVVTRQTGLGKGPQVGASYWLGSNQPRTLDFLQANRHQGSVWAAWEEASTPPKIMGKRPASAASPSSPEELAKAVKASAYQRVVYTGNEGAAGTRRTSPDPQAKEDDYAILAAGGELRRQDVVLVYHNEDFPALELQEVVQEFWGSGGRHGYFDNVTGQIKSMSLLELEELYSKRLSNRCLEELAPPLSEQKKRRLRQAKALLAKIKEYPHLYLEDDEDTLKDNFQFFRSTGSRRINNKAGLEAYVAEVETKFRTIRCFMVETKLQAASGGSRRLPPLVLFLTILLYFQGVSGFAFQVLTNLGVAGSYSFGYEIAKQISAAFLATVLPSFLAEAVTIVKREAEEAWGKLLGARVFLAIADNFVKLSKNNIKTADQSLMNTVPTIMYAFRWFDEPLELPPPDLPLSPPFDESFKKCLLDILENEKARRLGRGEMVPYLDLFTEADINSARDKSAGPRTPAFTGHNRAGQFGRFQHFQDYVVNFILLGIGLMVGGALVHPIVIFLFDQEGAWAYQKMLNGIYVAGVTVPVASYGARTILSFAVFHAQKNYLETVVLQPLNLNQFWSYFWNAFGEKKGTRILDAKAEFKRAMGPVVGLKTFMKNHRDRWPVEEDLTASKINQMLQDRLIDLAFKMDIIIRNIDDSISYEFAEHDDEEDAENQEDEELMNALDADAIEEARANAALVDDQSDEREEVEKKMSLAVKEKERATASGMERSITSFARRFPLHCLIELQSSYKNLKLPGATDPPVVVKFNLMVEELAAAAAAAGGGDDSSDAEEEQKNGDANADEEDESATAQEVPLYTGGQQTKDRLGAGPAYTRLRFQVIMAFTYWVLVGRFMALYHLSQTDSFKERWGVVQWDHNFIASLDEPYSRGAAPPVVPFAIDDVITWAKGEFPAFYFLWYHMDLEIRLGVEPYEEVEERGNPLPLWNSLFQTACILIAAERIKIARVNLSFLAYLLYWKAKFSGTVLPYLASKTKWIYQDVIIEWWNRSVALMCKMANVAAGYIAMCCHCVPMVRTIKSWFRINLGVDGGTQREDKSSLHQRREKQWTPKFASSRQAVQDFFKNYITGCLKVGEMPYKDFKHVNTIQAVVTSRLEAVGGGGGAGAAAGGV
eukprot:g4086.t1